ncbi:hypothetical protein MRX96_022861 [Rhipicephalus microplus]
MARFGSALLVAQGRKQVRQQVYRILLASVILVQVSVAPASSAPANQTRQTRLVVESSPHTQPRISRRHDDLARSGRCSASKTPRYVAPDNAPS